MDCDGFNEEIRFKIRNIKKILSKIYIVSRDFENGIVYIM